MRLHQRMHLVAAHINGSPVHVVKARLVPTGVFQPRVVGLALEKVRFNDRAGYGFPTSARADVGDGAVGEFEVQLGPHARVLAVKVAVAPEPDVPAEPPIRQHGAYGVRAVANEFGDIVGPVIHALVVVSPARREEVIADAMAVEVHVHEAQRGGVERGAGHGFLHEELTAEEGCRREKGVVELQLAPGLGPVIAHHPHCGQNRGVERNGQPVVAEMIRGLPCSLCDVPNNLPVFKRDDKLRDQPGITGAGILDQHP